MDRVLCYLTEMMGRCSLWGIFCIPPPWGAEGQESQADNSEIVFQGAAVKITFPVTGWKQGQLTPASFTTAAVITAQTKGEKKKTLTALRHKLTLNMYKYHLHNQGPDKSCVRTHLLIVERCDASMRKVPFAFVPVNLSPLWFIQDVTVLASETSLILSVNFQFF